MNDVVQQLAAWGVHLAVDGPWTSVIVIACARLAGGCCEYVVTSPSNDPLHWWCAGPVT